MAVTKPIRILIVDNCPTDRNTLKKILLEQPDFQVVGEAANGQEAVDLAKTLQPSLITMDLEMPVMSGVAAINHIMHQKAVPILVVSTKVDSSLAYQALEQGALEVINKPSYGTEDAQVLVEQARLLAGVSVITRLKSYNKTSVSNHLASVMAFTSASSLNGPIFALASSTGGPKALANLLSVLPADFPAPLVIAQHMSDGFVEGMAQWLSTLSNMPVKVAEEGEQLQLSQVYISPSHQHLTFTPEQRIKLVDCTQKDIYHPSCDAMLTSVAEVFGAQAIGIIMTGMGRDGTKGMAAIHAKGGITLAQDEASSVIYGMNAEAVAAGVIHLELPLASLSEEMLKILLLKPKGYLAALYRGDL